MILLESMSLSFFIYFSTIFKSKNTAILLAVTTILLLLGQMKLVEISNFISFKSLFILSIYTFDCAITLFTLFILIGIIICFLQRSLVVILSLGLSF